jgi:hypothetical protein
MLTKDQVAKLSAEDQEILAKIELGKGRRRQLLLQRARGLDRQSRYFPLYIFAMFMVFITLYYFNIFQFQHKPAAFLILAGVIVFNLFVFYIGRANRRLDALVELLEEEGKLQNGGEPSKTE